jgi:hypothetical protein
VGFGTTFEGALRSFAEVPEHLHPKSFPCAHAPVAPSVDNRQGCRQGAEKLAGADRFQLDEDMMLLRVVLWQEARKNFLRLKKSKGNFEFRMQSPNMVTFDVYLYVAACMQYI